MKVYNQAKTQELQTYDLKKGYLKSDRILKSHHEATEEIAEVSHYETVAEYPNGGKDIKKVIDTPFTPAREAYDEYEDIRVYVPYTEKELARMEITELKINLKDTDYKALKYAEGFLSEAEYAQTKAQRQEWRNRINELEVKL